MEGREAHSGVWTGPRSQESALSQRGCCFSLIPHSSFPAASLFWSSCPRLPASTVDRWMALGPASVSGFRPRPTLRGAPGGLPPAHAPFPHRTGARRGVLQICCRPAGRWGSEPPQPYPSSSPCSLPHSLGRRFQAKMWELNHLGSHPGPSTRQEGNQVSDLPSQASVSPAVGWE